MMQPFFSLLDIKVLPDKYHILHFIYTTNVLLTKIGKEINMSGSTTYNLKSGSKMLQTLRQLDLTELIIFSGMYV